MQGEGLRLVDNHGCHDVSMVSFVWEGSVNSQERHYATIEVVFGCMLSRFWKIAAGAEGSYCTNASMASYSGSPRRLYMSAVA
jgi:hypothetical protein